MKKLLLINTLICVPTEPGEVSHELANPWSRNGAADYGKWYIAENIMEGSDEVTFDTWKGVVPSLTSIKDVQEGNPMDLTAISGLKLDQPWPAMAINQQTTEEAYQAVMKNAGVTLPQRDAVDTRIIYETHNGYASYEGASYKTQHEVSDRTKKSGIIDSQKDVGELPELKNSKALIDYDHDGMPDDWEETNGLNPNDVVDRNNLSPEGYTMLEIYLNSIH